MTPRDFIALNLIRNSEYVPQSRVLRDVGTLPVSLVILGDLGVVDEPLKPNPTLYVRPNTLG
jgi:hypothetical protein